MRHIPGVSARNSGGSGDHARPSPSAAGPRWKDDRVIDDAGPAATLVLVCTANVCRSPLAERVIAARLAGRGWLGGVPVASAGVRAAEGQPMCAVSATLLEPGEPSPD